MRKHKVNLLHISWKNRARRARVIFEFNALPPRFSLLALSLLTAALSLLVPNRADAQSAAERFLWDQANTRITHASQPEDFLKAAETYQRLLEENLVNPALLNNLGCALTMGGDYANAVKAFERAERYSGTTLETTQGIIAALSRRENSANTEMPWYHTAFFWHFRVPTRLRVLTALAGWSLIWIGVLFYVLRRRQTHKALNIILTLSETFMITGAMMLLLFGASSIFTILQEHQDQSYWRNVEFSGVDIRAMEET